MNWIFFIYQWLIAAPILIVITAISAIIALIVTPISGENIGYWVAHIWAKIWCFMLFIKVKVDGRENIDSKQSYIFIANHQGVFDIFAIYGFLNHHFNWMMKKSLENIPLVGLACKSIGHVMVDRSSRAAIKHTMETAIDRLERGNSLVIFPEGARTKDGKVHSFKRGAFILATEFNKPIVPLSINGAYNIMPRSTLNVKPGTIILTIHKPIIPGENGHDIETAMQLSHTAINSAL